MSSSAPQKQSNDAQPLWTPSQNKIENSNLTKFVDSLGTGQFSDYHALWQWTNDNPEKFWNHMWDFAGVIGEKGDRVLINKDKMPGADSMRLLPVCCGEPRETGMMPSDLSYLHSKR